MKYFEWHEYIEVVWLLKYFYNKDEYTIKHMIKFHQGLYFPLHISFFVPRVESYTFMVYPEIVEKHFFFDTQKGFEEKVVCFLDQI